MLQSRLRLVEARSQGRARILHDRKVVANKMADGYLRSRRIKSKVRFELDGIEQAIRPSASSSAVPGAPMA
jgi:hypothetical protein